jgi:hypothetical protein
MSNRSDEETESSQPAGHGKRPAVARVKVVPHGGAARPDLARLSWPPTRVDVFAGVVLAAAVYLIVAAERWPFLAGLLVVCALVAVLSPGLEGPLGLIWNREGVKVSANLADPFGEGVSGRPERAGEATPAEEDPAELPRGSSKPPTSG